ncbi:MAG: PrsW family intramembrane metalloprotease [Candidatus Kapabacteria bacterium]|nr:PrsW family intramembrane metalloprotease [Candidatus Kapabacteria bacterium]
MLILIAILPVILFTIILIYLDSFKLIKSKYAIIIFLISAVLAVLAYPINSAASVTNLPVQPHINFIIPIIEEILKFSIFFILYRRNQAGFLTDTMIYGFIIGSGFAFTENIYYYYIKIPEPTFMQQIVRGFGTAIMHAASTGLAATILLYLNDIRKKDIVLSSLIALTTAIAIHIMYNSFLISPELQAALVIIIFTSGATLLFQLSDRYIKSWIGSEFDTDLKFLEMLNSGDLKNTSLGQFIEQIKSKFSQFIIFDIICFIRLNLELSIQFKSYLMLKEQSVQRPHDPELQDKITEYEYLKRSIGKTALATLRPILQIGKRELWMLKQLDS